jgi:hypothetical protein
MGLVWDVKDTLHDPPRIYAQRRGRDAAAAASTLETHA